MDRVTIRVALLHCLDQLSLFFVIVIVMQFLSDKFMSSYASELDECNLASRGSEGKKQPKSRVGSESGNTML